MYLHVSKQVYYPLIYNFKGCLFSLSACVCVAQGGKRSVGVLVQYGQYKADWGSSCVYFTLCVCACVHMRVCVCVRVCTGRGIECASVF